MPILRNWKVLEYYSSVHLEKVQYLTGQVFNDTRFPDGAEIRTSAVLEMKDSKAITQNTTYILAED